MVIIREHCSATALELSADVAPGGHHLGHSLLVQVKDHQLVAGLHQILAHGLAHNAQADKTNFHSLFTSRTVLFYVPERG